MPAVLSVLVSLLAPLVPAAGFSAAPVTVTMTTQDDCAQALLRSGGQKVLVTARCPDKGADTGAGSFIEVEPLIAGNVVGKLLRIVDGGGVTSRLVVATERCGRLVLLEGPTATKGTALTLGWASPWGDSVQASRGPRGVLRVTFFSAQGAEQHELKACRSDRR